MVLAKVQWWARISGSHAEAEKRRRSTRVAPVPKAGKTMDASALPWKRGIAQ